VANKKQFERNVAPFKKIKKREGSFKAAVRQKVKNIPGAASMLYHFDC